MLAVSTLTALSLVVMPTIAEAAAPASPITVPVVGTLPGGGSFTGSFSLSKFAVGATGVDAVGTLTGTLTSATGVVTQIVKNISLPVLVTESSCDILHLDLGPLSLNLLGLQVDLSRIVLDITAQTGSGKLLGNLLCAVAGLLDNPSGLARVLNDILGAL
jgi:hypothetical protein